MSMTSSPLSSFSRLYDFWSCCDLTGSTVITAILPLAMARPRPLHAHVDLVIVTCCVAQMRLVSNLEEHWSLLYATSRVLGSCCKAVRPYAQFAECLKVDVSH